MQRGNALLPPLSLLPFVACSEHSCPQLSAPATRVLTSRFPSAPPQAGPLWEALAAAAREWRRLLECHPHTGPDVSDDQTARPEGNEARNGPAHLVAAIIGQLGWRQWALEGASALGTLSLENQLSQWRRHAHITQKGVRHDCHSSQERNKCDGNHTVGSGTAHSGMSRCPGDHATPEPRGAPMKAQQIRTVS